MQCPECQGQVGASGICACGWMNPDRPALPRRNVQDHTEQEPKLDRGRARAALGDIAQMTGRHLRAGLDRETIIRNWRWARDHAASRCVWEMARDALRRLGAAEDREPGEDDEPSAGGTGAQPGATT